MNPIYLQADAFEHLYWVPEYARRIALHVDCFNDMLGDDNSPFNDPHDLDLRGESILRAGLPHTPGCLRLVTRWSAHGETARLPWAPYVWSEPDVDHRFGPHAVELQSDRVVRIMAGGRKLGPEDLGPPGTPAARGNAVDLNTYEISSQPIIHALKAACRRGVDVRVMLEMQSYHGEKMVAREKKALNGCIHLKSAPPRFTGDYHYDHAKYVVADPKTHPMAELGTANYSWSAFHRNSEYLWDTKNPHTIGALTAVFDADWQHHKAGAGPRQTLVLSPHSGNVLVALISQKGPVDIEAEELGSAKGILAALKAKGKQARLILPASISHYDRRHAKALAAAGAQIRLLKKKPYMHAKMIVGHTYAFIGSQNFSGASVDHNREVGVALQQATSAPDPAIPPGLAAGPAVLNPSRR